MSTTDLGHASLAPFMALVKEQGSETDDAMHASATVRRIRPATAAPSILIPDRRLPPLLTVSDTGHSLCLICSIASGPAVPCVDS
eukprot:scaffold159980_cov43-Prasinocladus_malaysianus.AAC.2